MKLNNNSIIVLGSTGLLALSITAVSLVGMLTPAFYLKETSNWQAQSLGQDIVDLFVIVPALIITGIISARMNRTAYQLWAGILLYIIYTFIIYCFDVHFGVLFPLYCMILGLSFYSFLLFIYKQPRHSVTIEPINKLPAKLTGIYFITIAGLFYFLWLAEIIPSIGNNSIPESLKLSGLPTNPVHVIDLSVFLPAIFITGVLVLKHRSAGAVLSTVFLCFFILMDVTISWLAFRMNPEGSTSNRLVIFVMLLLAAISFMLLLFNLKNKKTKTSFPFRRSAKGLRIKPNSPF
jgi:hypothetical protein